MPKDGSGSMPYRRVLWAAAGLHFALLAGGVLAAAHANPAAIVGMAASMGAEGGIMFTVAHELLHSPRWVVKRVGGREWTEWRRGLGEV